MAQNNDGPGKRLKREQAKNNILYVNRPDDPRLQMYRDSLEANKIPQGLNREIAFMNTMTQQDRYKYYDNKYGRLNMWSGNGRSQRFLNKKQLDKSHEAEKRLFQTTKQPFTKEDKTIRTDIVAPSGTYFEVIPERPGGTKYSFPEYGLKENPPKRPVVFRPEEPIEPLAPRQASLPKLSSEIEYIAPVMRPQKEYEAKYVGMGSNLRYPSQDFMSKVKARITGEPLMPYWIDAEGVKRYPSMGENNPEEVQMMEMLKSDLSPNNPEDAVELKRIELLRKMSPKDRRKFMESNGFAQE